ncbi:unnamed protein product [Auanema sp. JU1783]|nr:unnamed protein product [Auanema sp. JU1783]
MGFLKKVGVAVDPQLASTVAVHLSLICGVIAYTIFGALMMQFLESPRSVSVRLKREEKQRITQVFLGSEVSEMDGGVHACLRHVALRIFNDTTCRENELESLNINNIDSCYQFAKFQGVQATSAYAIDPTESIEPALSPEELIAQEIIEEMNKWSFGNALIFAFTVITTIGYGHVAPETFYGRLFCIIYGVLGVPLTLLTIADMGMFFTHCMRKLLQLGRWLIHRSKTCFKTPKKSGRKEKVQNDLCTARELTEDTEGHVEVNGVDAENENEEENNEEAESQERKTDESIALAVTFALYLLMGAKVLSVYEPEMDFFEAFYFNFVTLTTIGLGDFVPKSFDYLFITLVYIGVGLSLTTMAIEIAADLLKKIHYAGRKMENMANAVVWFGGKKMTMKNLVKYLGDQFNIDEEELANLNLDQFVDNAIKVEAGEMKSLRKPVDPVVFRNRPVSFSYLRKSSESTSLYYVDDRQSKTTAELSVIPEDTFRTVDMLRITETSSLQSNNLIPRLDLDHQFFTDSSIPNSFEEDYLKTLSANKLR